MKKEPTLEEWKEIGVKAKEVRANLNELYMLLSGKLPLSQYENKLDKLLPNVRTINAAS